jgi:hypothetical protein
VEFPLTLESQDSLRIRILFNPSEIRAFSGTVTVHSDDPISQETLVGLLGTGKTENALMQNFPSPFRIAEHGRTYFPFNLFQGAEVAVSIRTLSGEMVKMLDIGHLDAGQYQDTDILTSINCYWDGTNEDEETVASGVYLYTVKAGDFVETKKMAVIR